MLTLPQNPAEQYAKKELPKMQENRDNVLKPDHSLLCNPYVKDTSRQKPYCYGKEILKIVSPFILAFYGSSKGNDLN